MFNMRSLGHVAREDFHFIYGISKQLHELEIVTATPTEQGQHLIETLHNTIYDCFVLNRDHRVFPQSQLLATQSSLLAVCLRLCAWEKALRYIFRGGGIERNRQQTAKIVLGDDTTIIQSLNKLPGGANSNALV